MSSVWTYGSLLLLILVNTALCFERPSFKLLGDEIRNKLLKLSEEYTDKDAVKNINEISDLKNEENSLNKQLEEFNFFNSTEEYELMNGSSIETRAVRNGYNQVGYYPVNNYGQYYPGFVAPNTYGAPINNFMPVGYIANPNVGYNNMNQNSRFVNGMAYNNIPSTAPIFGGTISNPNFYNNAGFSGHGPNPGFGNGGNNNFGSAPHFGNQNNPSLGYRDSSYNGGGFNSGGYSGGNPSNFNSGYNNGYPNSGYTGGNPNMGFNGGNQNFGVNHQNMGYNSNNSPNSYNNPNGMTNPNTGFPITSSNNAVGNSKPNSGNFNANVNNKPNTGNNNVGVNSGLVQPYGTNGPTNNNGNSGVRYTNLANSPPPKPFNGTNAGAPVTAKPIYSGVKVA